MRWKRYAPLLAVAALAALIAVLAYATGKKFYLTQLTMSAYYGLAALGLCLLLGYAGQISLGQAGFFAIGGYASAVLCRAGVDPRLAFLAAIALAALVAVLIGMPVLRLKGHYLAMATLGFGVIIEKIVRGTRFLGAADGISNVKAFAIIGPVAISGERTARLLNYGIAWGLLLIALFLLVNLLNSRSGRALRALHGSEEAASAMGVDLARAKLSVFVLAAVFAAAAGSFLTHYNGSIGPGEASVMKSIRYVSIVAVGGLSNFWGVLGMGLGLNFLSLRGVFGAFDDAVFGAILALVMLFAPEGIRLSKRLLPGSGKAKAAGGGTPGAKTSANAATKEGGRG
jgi:branched-chain amino acid transport system permease protein